MDPVSKAQAENVTHSSDKKGRSLANLKPWKKGQSGNPGGRRKKADITKIFEEIFDSGQDRDEIKDSIALTLKSGRMAGVLLLREAAERLEGKVVQAVDLSGDINVTLAETIAKRRKKADES